MTDDLLVNGKASETSVAGKQGAAGPVRQRQRKRVGERESGNSLAISDG